MTLALERDPRQRRRWGQLVARAWDDDHFRQRLLNEPEAVLREEGFDVPPGVEVLVAQGDEADAEEVAYLRLPAKPAADDLIEEDLRVPDGVYAHLCAQCACGSCHQSRPMK